MKVAKTILNLLIGLMFIATGILKLINMDSLSAAIFERADFPYWLFYIVGLFELAGGTMLLIEKTRKYGALMVIVVMVGALATHVYLGDPILHVFVPVVVILYAGSQLVSFKK
ncbi:MAG: DoxX family protein [Chitinophagaceae bacterium]|nr:DoxX family protein [Chitinophagaceae bacterium]